VISKASTDSSDCHSCSIQSLEINEDASRRCDFKLPEGVSLYDLASTPVPIICDEAVPLSGTPDQVEYPPAGSPARPPVGSMVIQDATNEQLCRRLVLDEAKTQYVQGDGRDIEARVPLGSEVVSLRNVGRAFRGFRNVELGGWRNGHVGVAELDIFNDSMPRRVFRISGGSHYFAGDLFVVTDLEVPKAQVIEMLDKQLKPSGGVDDIESDAISHGWIAFTGAHTVYRSTRYTYFKLFIVDGVCYILSFAGVDPTAVLLQPLRSGDMKTICVFQNVRANL
jgi:hypothetical protein